MRWTHPERGDGAAGRVHRPRRGDRADLGARRMGAAAGLHAGGALVGAGQGGDQPVAAADQARPDRGGAAGAGRPPACRPTGWSSRSPSRSCCRTARTRSPPCTSCASSACASPWTISAPATARSATCAASPSTRSRSTGRSSPTSTAAPSPARSSRPSSGSAQCLGMATVAEGIENFEQLQLVRGAGCTRGAGLLLQRAGCRDARSSACSTARSPTPATRRDAGIPSPHASMGRGSGEGRPHTPALEFAAAPHPDPLPASGEREEPVRPCRRRCGLPTGSSAAAFDHGRWLTAATRHRPGAPCGLR